MALLGQNLGKIDLPFRIPDGFGAITYEIAENGTHYIVIFSKINHSGKFWFATGTKEIFGFSSLSDLNKNISRVKSFHKSSISPSTNISLQNKELGWQTRLKDIGYFKFLNIYLLAGLILLFLIFMIVKIRTTPK